MQCVLITNPAENYVDSICKYISSLQSRGSGGSFEYNCLSESDVIGNYHSGRQTGAHEPVIISSSEEYDDISKFKGVFKNKSNANTIFIVPELDWDGNCTFEPGYKIAMELLGGKLKNKFFNLVFISCYSCDQLLSRVSQDYAELVKSFPHIPFEDILFGNYPDIPVPSYTELHFSLLKRIVLPGPGHLGLIKHNLSNYKTLQYQEARGVIKGILDELSQPAYGGLIDWKKEEISKLRKRNDEMISDSESKALITDIGNYIEYLKNELASGGKHSGKIFPQKVLIIEDDSYWRENLRTFFNSYFSNVTVVEADDNLFRNEGDSLKNAKKWIAEIAGSYDIIVMDLLFTPKAQNCTLSFNGFDLYDFLRDKEQKIQKRNGKVRRAAVRMVTSLPRYEISLLRKECFETPVIYTKGYGWLQLEGFLKDGMDELTKECLDNHKSFTDGLHAPKNGLFEKWGVLDAVLRNTKALSDAADYSRKVAARENVMTEYSLPSTDDESPTVIIKHLKAIMAHRRLVIKFAKGKRRNVFKESDYASFIKLYLPEGATFKSFKRDYLTTKLGFSTSKGKDDPAYGFVCVLNFSGEIFDLEKDAFEPSPEDRDIVSVWVDAVASFLKDVDFEKCAGDYYATVSSGDLISAFGDSGIKSFLDNGVSIETFIRMLDSVDKYIHDDSKSLPLREWLAGLFIEDKIALGSKGEKQWQKQRKVIRNEYYDKIFIPYKSITSF